MVLRQLGASQSSQSAILMLNGMIFGGVFHRHPKLTLVFAELGIHWFAGRRAAHGQPRAGPAGVGRLHGPIRLRVDAQRVCPPQRADHAAAAAHQSPVRLLEEFPECVVFSSDYAHNESNPEPTAHYEPILADVKPDVRASFLGGNLAECFARTGNPLPPVSASGV